MNQHKLTLKTNTTRLTVQILLLLLFTLSLAVPSLAQVTERTKEQSESSTLSDQAPRKTVPVIDLVRLMSDEQEKDPAQKSFAFNFADREVKRAEEPNAALSEIFVPSRAKNSLFTRSTEASSPSPQADPDLSNFAFFVSAGVAIPHGDLNIFLDPGFSINAGLEYMITSQFSAEGTFGYHRFSSFFGGDASLYQLSGNGKFYFVDETSSVRPFVNGGVGAYVTDSATTHFGGNIGVGILFEVTPHFGLLGSYNFHAFTAGDGFRFSTVQGGVRFRF